MHRGVRTESVCFVWQSHWCSQRSPSRRGSCSSPELGPFLLLLWMGEEVTPRHNFPKYAKIPKRDKQTGGEFRSGVCCLHGPRYSTGDIKFQLRFSEGLDDVMLSWVC